VLVLAGVLAPSVMDTSTGGAWHPGVAATLVLAAAVGAAALLVGTGLRRSLRGARAGGLAVQAALLAAALQSHRPVLIGVVAAVTVVTSAVLMAPALVPVAPTPPQSGRAPGD